jgi:succinate dehydrogenase / fumarate reductase cytochrome b subunit
MAVSSRQNSRSKWSRFVSSSVGRKYLTGITGIALILFLIVHLLGNLTLFIPDNGQAFNAYAYKLHSLGPLVVVIEIGLLAIILIHALIGVSIWLRKRQSRPVAYKTYKSVGGASKQGISARSMIITGVIMFIFLVVHVATFRFGVGAASVETTVDGHVARDVYRLVHDAFKVEGIVIFYLAVVTLVAFHLRHGIWSALQSLAAMKPKASPAIYTLALILAVLLGLGFFVLPIYMYFA